MIKADISTTDLQRRPLISRLAKEAMGITLWVRLYMAGSLLAWFLLPNTVFSATSPWQFVQRWSSHTLYFVDRAVITLFTVIVTVLFFVWASKKERAFRTEERAFRCSGSAARGAPDIPLWLPLACFLAPMFVTLLLPVRYHSLVLGIEGMIVAICTGLLAAWLCAGPKGAAWVLCSLGIVQAGYTLWYQRYQINILVSGDVQRAGGTFGDPYGVYVVMIPVVAVAVAKMIQSHSSVERGFYSVAVAMAGAALISTWTRGGVLGLAVAIAWLIGTATRNTKATVLAALVLLAIYGAVAYHRTASNLDQRSSARAVAGRVSLWREGILIFSNNWLTGVGIGALNIPEHRSGGDARATPQIVDGEPKNLLLDWLDELGVGGGIVFVLFLLTIGRQINYAWGTVEARGIAAAWIALLVAGMFDTPFGTMTRYHGNAVFGFLLGATRLLAFNGTPVSQLPTDTPVAADTPAAVG